MIISQVKKDDIKSYSGNKKPPCFELSLRKTPKKPISNKKLILAFSGIKKPFEIDAINLAEISAVSVRVTDKRTGKLECTSIRCKVSNCFIQYCLADPTTSSVSSDNNATGQFLLCCTGLNDALFNVIRFQVSYISKRCGFTLSSTRQVAKL